MDPVILHWVMVVAPTEEGMEGLDLSKRDLAPYFYVNDCIIAWIQPWWL